MQEQEPSEKIVLGEKTDPESTRLFSFRWKDEIRTDTSLQKSLHTAACFDVNI